MSNEWPDQHPALPPNATEPPPPLLRAVNLMYVGAALSLISLVVNLADREGIRDQVREGLRNSGLEVTEEAINSGIALAMATIAFIGAVTIGLWVLMAISNKRGKSWARIMATVLGAISIVIGVSGLAAALSLGGGGFGLAVLLTVLSIALSAAILFFLWRPENNPYYAWNSQRRV